VTTPDPTAALVGLDEIRAAAARLRGVAATRTQALGIRTFAHLRVLLDGVVTVSEEEIAAAVRLAAEEARLVVEPSGALAIAALRFRASAAGVADAPGSVVCVVSGGNVDPARFLAYPGAPIPSG
jgi:threonine dehydratase